MSTKLRQLEREADIITDESLASTERMVKITAETTDIANNISTELNTQRETLERIDNNLSVIEQNIDIAENKITKMESFLGCFVLPWRRTKKIKRSKKVTPDRSDVQSVQSTHFMDHMDHHSKDQKYISQITGDAREKKMEENMAIVSDAVKNLHRHAIVISDELDVHAELINNIKSKIDHNTTKINSSDARIAQLMH